MTARYYRRVYATRTPEPGRYPARDCGRCGRTLYDPRPETINCADCRNVLYLEEALERHGIDIESIPEETLIEWSESTQSRRKNAMARYMEKNSRRARAA